MSLPTGCLHGAWVREEFSPDPELAELYYRKAVELAKQDLEAFYKKKYQNEPQNGQQVNNGQRFLEMEKDKALTEILNRMARFYGRIGEDQQAATIWTRLWKLVEKDVPHVTGETSAGIFGSLFGGASADRTLITQQDGVPFAKNAADCWMRLGEYGLAEEALGWTLNTIAISNSDTSLDAASTSTPSIEEIGLLSTLGALYVRQAKFDYALSVFVKALQLVQGHRAGLETRQGEETSVSATTVNSEKDMWFCREAILTHSIGETLYGAATASPSSSSPLSTGANSETKSEAAEQKKSSSSWKFWSSGSSSSSKSASASSTTLFKSVEQHKKEEEALGWMQKAVAMAKEKSGQNRDCDECAALGLSNLGLIYEMDGKTDVALAQFKEAVIYATQANDYVGLDDYNKNIVRLTEKIASASESTEPLSSSPPSSLSSSS
ncbi:hypothetical protein BGZ58_000147 [Dissophora ornata]|nr:hypothetical protein BGZ58_000147 [Dissophora ornata]